MEDTSLYFPLIYSDILRSKCSELWQNWDSIAVLTVFSGLKFYRFKTLLNVHLQTFQVYAGRLKWNGSAALLCTTILTKHMAALLLVCLERVGQGRTAGRPQVCAAPLCGRGFDSMQWHVPFCKCDQ